MEIRDTHFNLKLSRLLSFQGVPSAIKFSRGFDYRYDYVAGEDEQFGLERKVSLTMRKEMNNPVENEDWLRQICSS